MEALCGCPMLLIGVTGIRRMNIKILSTVNSYEPLDSIPTGYYLINCIIINY
jgi:hypothetical protein